MNPFSFIKTFTGNDLVDMSGSWKEDKLRHMLDCRGAGRKISLDNEEHRVAGRKISLDVGQGMRRGRVDGSSIMRCVDPKGVPHISIFQMHVIFKGEARMGVPRGGRAWCPFLRAAHLCRPSPAARAFRVAMV